MYACLHVQTSSKSKTACVRDLPGNGQTQATLWGSFAEGIWSFESRTLSGQTWSIHIKYSFSVITIFSSSAVSQSLQSLPSVPQQPLVSSYVIGTWHLYQNHKRKQTFQFRFQFSCTPSLDTLLDNKSSHNTEVKSIFPLVSRMKI